jgi:hypothetical protein
MGRRTVKTRTLVMFPALCLLLLLVGCGGSSEGSSSDTKTLVLDIQPDFDKFDFTDSQTDEKLDFGDHFLFEGPVYEEGTTENVGTWFCAGVKFATLKETALDKPLTLTGAIDGNYANVYVTYVLRGRGTNRRNRRVRRRPRYGHECRRAGCESLPAVRGTRQRRSA